eukprot:TRINITY_DN13239_c0_g1_i1.p3 TRINITY_DN13239_c0_g1~~TRINITY_DN13239_c0_g1_i1.p3  ORF type:complete len:100 (-),score=19.48 TRINITY_DN13239_c0_g1_i1:54-353(-)
MNNKLVEYEKVVNQKMVDYKDFMNSQVVEMKKVTQSQSTQGPTMKVTEVIEIHAPKDLEEINNKINNATKEMKRERRRIFRKENRRCLYCGLFGRKYIA